MSVRQKSPGWQIGALGLVAVLAGASFLLVNYLGNEANELAKQAPVKAGGADVADSNKPIIHLVGEENVTIPLGGQYVELGATAKAKDGSDLTDKVKVTGADKIDTSISGLSYPVEYTVTDKDGNSITVTRHIAVDDSVVLVGDSVVLVGDSVGIGVGIGVGVVLDDDIYRPDHDLGSVNGLRVRGIIGNVGGPDLVGHGGRVGSDIIDGDVDLGALDRALIREDEKYAKYDVVRDEDRDLPGFEKEPVQPAGEAKTIEPPPGEPVSDTMRASQKENQRSSGGGGAPPNPAGSSIKPKPATGEERATLGNVRDGQNDSVLSKRQEVADDADALNAIAEDKSGLDAGILDRLRRPGRIDLEDSDSEKSDRPADRHTLGKLRSTVVGAANGAVQRNKRRPLELAEKALSYVAFNTPEKIPFGEPSYIQFVMDPTLDKKQIVKLVNEAGPVATARIKITREMEVFLTGEKFEITAISAEKQMIALDDTTEWKWSIVPQRPGKHRVHLVVNAIIRVDGVEMKRSKSFDRYIEIEVTGVQQTVIFMQDNWPWLALGFVPFLFFGPMRSSRFWRNRKAAKAMATTRHDESRPIDAFVSYSSKDRAIVLPLVESLRGRGYNVWVDHGGLHGASQWSEQIVGAIENTTAFVLISSKHSFDSHNVVKETSLASEQRKHLLPVFIEDAEVPQSLQYQLAGLQRVDYSEQAHAEGVQQIVDALTKLGVTGSEQTN